MHKNRRVDLIKLQELVDQGMSGRDMAKALGVTPPAISRNLKSLGLARTGDFTLRCAKKVNDQKIDAMAQLARINEAVERQLVEIQAELGKATGEQKPDLRDAQIKHTAELRKQLELLLQIGRTLFNLEEVSAFQKMVLEEIGNESQECRSRILKRLQQRRSTSGLPGFSEHIV